MPRPTPRGAALAAVLLLVAIGPVVPVAGAAGADDCSFPVTSVDATGTSVRVDAEPAEVVTLAPSAAQTMWEIGARGKVTGVSTNADYLAGTASRTSITTYPAVDVETVLNLDPDLVLAPNAVSDEDVERLRSLGLTVYEFEAAEDVEDVYAKTRLTGRLVGACDGAEASVAGMKARISAVREAVEGRERPPVFYHMGGGWTAGRDTFIDEIVTTAGGENVGASAGIATYGVLSPEVLVSEDPEWFVRGSVPVPSASPYSDTTAGREGHVVVVNADYMNQPGPRIVEPIETIAEALHPGVDVGAASEGGVNADLTGETPTVESGVAGDGGVSVAVSGLYASRSTRVGLPDGGGLDGGVALRSIELALREPNPSFLLTVADGGRDGRPPAGGTITRFSVAANGLEPAEVDRVGLRLHVDAGALEERGAGPASLRLYRREAGTWRPLETRAVRYQNGTVAVTANASSIGAFALGVEPAAAETEPSPGTDAPGTTAAPTPTTASPRDDAGGTTTATTTAAPATTAAPGQPGFGALLACVGLLAAVGVRRRGWSP